MLELLRDPLWQFVGVLLAIVALAVSFIIYSLQRQRKTLSFEVVSRNQLLTVGEELEGKLQVLYEGHPAKDICLIVLKLFNSGNVPVATADYERPISFCTGAGSKILSAAVTEREPEALSVETEVDQIRIVVQPVLLNAKDSITLKLLVSDFSGSVVADARIVGVKAITRVGESSGYFTFLMVCGLAMSAFGIVFALTHLPKPAVESTLPGEVKFGIVVFAIGYVAMLVGMLKNRRFRLRLWRFLGRRG